MIMGEVFVWFGSRRLKIGHTYSERTDYISTLYYKEIALTILLQLK